MPSPFRTPLSAFLLAAALVAAASPATAAISDTVEETARRGSHLAEILDGVAEERAAAERALVVRTIEVASGAEGAGGYLAHAIAASLPFIESFLSPLGFAGSGAVQEMADAIAASIEVDDARASAASARVAQLSSWMDDLGAMIAAEDEATAEALSAGRRVGPLPPDVERWRPMVAAHFPASRVNEALLVIACESRGDPEAGNRRSGASGLFQFLRGTWEHTIGGLGRGGASREDPEASIAAAAWLVTASEAAGIDPWAHWSCRP